MRPKALNQSGVGLVEVMVAASMLGGLSLVVMQLTENSQKSVTRMEKGMEILELDAEINSAFSNKRNCMASINGGEPGTPVSTAVIAGATRYPAAAPGLIIREFNNITGLFETPYVFSGTPPVYTRNLVKLTDIYLTGYIDTAIVTPAHLARPAHTAFLVKKYHYQLGPDTIITKTKSLLLSITSPLPPNPSAGMITGCVVRSSETESIWVVDDYGIYYNQGTVAINTEAPTDIAPVLNVNGEAVIGRGNLIGPLNTTSDLDNHIFGGSDNFINGTSSTRGMVLGGRNNSVSSGVNNVVIGGLVNQVNSTGENNSISGGRNNLISGNATDSTLAASSGSIANSGANYSVILGGATHTMSGYGSAILGGELQTVSGSYSIVGGGRRNSATGLYGGIIAAQDGVLSGAYSAIVGGTSNTLTGDDSVVSGGVFNRITGARNAISGGINGLISGHSSAIIGGAMNTISGNYSVAVSGNTNSISGNFNGVLSGINNTASGIYSAVMGGSANTAMYNYNAIAGGSNNTTNGTNASILGGSNNEATGISSVIVGGINGRAPGEASGVFGGSSGTAAGPYSAVMAGYLCSTASFSYNSACIASSQTAINGNYSASLGGHNHLVGGHFSAIVGGLNNVASGYASVALAGNFNNTYAPFSVVAGGQNNLVMSSGTSSSVLGGQQNVTDGVNTTIASGLNNTITNASMSWIGGGERNRVEYHNYGAVLAGYQNRLNWGGGSVILGGVNNLDTSYRSLLFGNEIYNTLSGNVVLTDALDHPLVPYRDHSFWAKFANGYRLCTLNSVTCTYIDPLDTGWRTTSLKSLKEDFRDVDEKKVLEQVALLDITSWKYKKDKKRRRNIGPTVEDWNKLISRPLGLNADDNGIKDRDFGVISLLGIKALQSQTTKLRKENEELREQVNRLEDGMDKMRQYVNEINARLPVAKR